MKRAILLLVLALVVAGTVEAQLEPKGFIYIPAIDLHEPLLVAPIVNRRHVIGPDVYWLDQTADWGAAGGRVVLAAHSPGKFERVHELQIGDTITVYMPIATYRVVDIRVAPDTDKQWVMPTWEPTLTLITCTPGNLRLVITAEREF